MRKFDLGGTADSSESGGANIGGTLGSSIMKKGGSLKGKQKNLDLNKNGKLDSQDFKMIRGKMKTGGEVDSNYEKIVKDNWEDIAYAWETGGKKVPSSISNSDAEDFLNDFVFFADMNEKEKANAISKFKNAFKSVRVTKMKTGGGVDDYTDIDELYKKLKTSPNFKKVEMHKNEEGDDYIYILSKLKGEGYHKNDLDEFVVDYVEAEGWYGLTYEPSGNTFDIKNVNDIYIITRAFKKANGGGLADVPESFPETDAISYKNGGAITDKETSEITIGTWLLNSPDGRKMIKKTKNSNELKNNAIEYMKKGDIIGSQYGNIDNKKINKNIDWEYIFKNTKYSYKTGGEVGQVKAKAWIITEEGGLPKIRAYKTIMEAHNNVFKQGGHKITSLSRLKDVLSAEYNINNVEPYMYVKQMANGGGLADVPESFPETDAMSYKDGGGVGEVVKGKYYNIYDPGMDIWNDWQYISYTPGYHTFREEAPMGGGTEIKFTDEELKNYLKENLIKNSYKNGGQLGATKGFEYSIGGL